MLSISNISEAMGAFYYEKDDYYSRENSPAPSEFIGAGAKMLGLSEFDKDIYKKLIRGLNPDGKFALTYLKQLPIKDETYTVNLEKTVARCLKNGMTDDQCQEVKDLFNRQFKGKTIDPMDEKSIGSEITAFLDGGGFTGNKRKAIRNELTTMATSLRNNGRRAGYDLTFNAPKSVSLQVLVNGDKNLLEAHKTAVIYAMSKVEGRSVGVRVGNKNNRQYQQTDNIVAATFPHGTSREGDPHLHTHVVMFNFTKRTDGKWRAIHNDEIYRQSTLIGLLYQNKLAEICQDLGYGIDVKPNGTFELKGFTEEQLKTFSLRHIQVREESARILYERDFASDLESKGLVYRYSERFGKAWFKIDITRDLAKKYKFNIIADKGGYIVSDGYTGRSSFEAKKNKYLKKVTQRVTRRGVLKDRARKSYVDYVDLARQWTARAKEACIPEIVPDKSTKKEWGKDVDLDFHEDHLGERTSTWSMLDCEIHALSRNLGRTGFEAIKSLMDQNSGSIKTDIQPEKGNDSHELLTNLRQLSREEDILNMVGRGRNRYHPIVEEGSIAGIKDEMGFTDGQAEMVGGVLTSKDFVTACLGVAGSGKSYAARSIKEHVERGGMKITGLAPDAMSAQALEEKSGIRSETIHRYLTRGRPKIGKERYEKHRVEFATKLARLGIHRRNLRQISLLINEEYNGTRFSNAKSQSIKKKIFELAGLEKARQKERFEAAANAFFWNVADKQTVIVVDEASKLSTDLMVNLIMRAKTDGNRLVLLGDLRQTGAVEAGNPVRNLIENKKILVFELPETVRQREHSLMRKVVDSASLSNRRGMAMSIDQLGDKVVTKKGKEERIGYAVREYMKLYSSGERDIMLLSDLNVDRHSLTQRLRDRLRDSGVIGRAETPVKVLIDRELTAAQKACSRYYERGDIVVFFKDTGKFKAKREYEVCQINNTDEKVLLKSGSKTFEVEASAIDDASVFRKDDISVSTGDTLRWTRNHERRVNKQLVEVIKATRNNLTVKDKKTGMIYRLNPNNNSYLDYGLVMTVYSSQGHDRDKGIFLAESNVSMNSWYTALSRMKKDVLVITENKDKLLDRISQSTTKLNALEFMEKKSGWIKRLQFHQKERDIRSGRGHSADRSPDLER